MALTDVVGRTYGPFLLRAASEKVDEYVAATGDLPQRWIDEAPPGFAAVALFAAAPTFFGDPEVAPFTKVLVHAEQRFAWHAPLLRDQDLTLTGAVESVKERRGLNFVAFSVVGDTMGERVLESHSQFIMAERPGGGLNVTEAPQGPALAKSRDEAPAPVALAPSGSPLPDLHKSASRADLVRYAGATRDWNPIHWDHEAAVAAGLGGVVVHGLLMAAWAMQAGTRASRHPAPVAAARFRFRKPMPAGTPGVVAAAVDGVADGGTAVQVTVGSAEEELVSATLTLRVA